MGSTPDPDVKELYNRPARLREGDKVSNPAVAKKIAKLLKHHEYTLSPGEVRLASSDIASRLNVFCADARATQTVSSLNADLRKAKTKKTKPENCDGTMACG